MKLNCSQCCRVLEYSGEKPSFCAYCGSPLPEGPAETTSPLSAGAVLSPESAALAAEAEPMPEQVGPYRPVRLLGTGGMGSVYEAEDASGGRRVALKLLAPHSADSPEALERFRQEGRLASQIAHPRCVLVLAADEVDGRPYIAMELMTGLTLRDLVEQQGPLFPEQAVAKILDVLEGLQEAHRMGVVHRDVKPSNCFLVADGRVKVGDFGLAKSLSSDVQLTRTGTFLGTPLFASPEQIKGEKTDFQTDVFSLAATLYFLLTGRAPFQQSNATATLAMIVSAPAPSLRTHRPDISAALDRVVLKGLHRNPNRRWRTLEDFRRALLPFMPEHSSMSGLGDRVGAFLIDAACFLPLWLLTRFLATLIIGERAGDGDAWVWYVKAVVDTLPWLTYFVLTEGLGGCSLGKRWLGIRVWPASGSDPPGLKRALVRTLVFFGCTLLIWDVLALASGVGDAMHWFVVWIVLQAAGAVALVAPMRAGNGYRGLHEWLSGTRVVRLPQAGRRRPLESLRGDGVARPPTASTPRAVGTYRVHGVLGPREEAMLLAEDSVLGRDVFVRLRPGDAPGLPAARRDVDRPARPRWLHGGRQGPWSWDAFVMVGGCPLADAVSPVNRLDWEELRPLLRQLGEELTAACRDGTLPEVLTVGQVWVEPDGQVSLLDWPACTPTDGEAVTAVLPQQRALALLGRVAILALEGTARKETTAPVPRYARRILDRLLGVTQPYGSVDELLADLAATRARPGRVTVRARVVHLAAVALVLAVGLASMFLSSTSFGALYDFEVARAMPRHVARARKTLAVLDNPAELDKLRSRLPGEITDRLDDPARRQALKGLLEERMSADEAETRTAIEKLGFWGRLLGIDGWAKGVVDNNLSADEFREAVRRASPEPETDDARGTTLGRILVSLSLWPFLWVIGSFLSRGGVTLPLLGLGLVGPDGRKASRWRCAWRTLVVWAPVTVMLALSAWLDSRPAVPWVLARGLWLSAVGLVVVYVVLALRSPARGPHDRLAGTTLVPR